MCCVGAVIDTGDIPVKETDKTPYLMEFIKESHTKYKIVKISTMKKRYEVLGGLVTRGFPPN